MDKKHKTLAEVAPVAKFPRDVAPSFTYRIPPEMEGRIRVGDVVKIPFRRKEVLGVVQKLEEERETGFELKNIKEIVDEMSLSKEQTELAHFISDYYFVPLGFIWKIMLPEIPKKAPRKEISFGPPPIEKELRPDLRDAEEKIHREIENRKKILLLHSLESGRHKLYQDIILKNKDAQSLVLLPEYFDIYDSAQSYIELFGIENVAVLCSDITKNQYFSQWQKIKSGEARIIIGTRQAVFAPFKKLGLIIADDIHNSSYKQWDQNPRYHGIESAVKLGEIWKAKTILSSSFPPLEDYHRTEKGFNLIDVSEKPKKIPKIIDMESERQGGNFSFISEKLKEKLWENVYARKQSAVFIPRLGEKTAYQCKDCGYLAECETCRNPLINYRGRLYCSRCKQLSDLLDACPKCQGHNIASFGGGSRRIFEEIEQIFKDKNIKIVEMDGSSEEESGRHSILADFRKGKTDILVGTQAIWKNWQMKNLGLIAVIFPEIIFSVPGFRSGEKARQFLGKVYAFAQEKDVIIQTRKPEHRYFQEMKDKSVLQLLEKECAARQENISLIPYPPYGKLIKLIYKHPDAKGCEKEAKWQYELIIKEIRSAGLEKSIEAMPPFPAQNYREYGKYRWHIILKHSNGLDLPSRNLILGRIKKDWIVDIDPDEIL